VAISVDQLEQDGFIEPLLDGMCLAVGMDGDDCLFEGEGLPEIARLKGGNLYDMVDEITQRGMMKKEEGGLSWEEGFAARLELLRLTDGDIKNLEGIYASRITPHAFDVIRVLQLQGIQPLIISGGIRQAIVPVAALMGVSEEHVYANTLIPDEDGFYTRYDTTTPLAQGRKDLLVADIRRQRNFVGRLAMVGDGHMDMRAITGSGIKIGFCAYTPRDGFILQGLRELQTHVVFNEAAIGFGENLQQLMHVLESEQEL
jgi:phosphoserine phosphatase